MCSGVFPGSEPVRRADAPLTAPFVLLDDAQAPGRTRLYRNPVNVIETWDAAAVPAALDRLRAGLAEGFDAAGYLSYEAGHAFEPKLGRPPGIDTPLVWFGLFRGWETVDAATLLPDPAGGWIGPAEPDIVQSRYEAQVREVLEMIAAGDLYQANLSFRATARIAGDPLSIYAALRARSGAGWGALIDTGLDRLLSLSPELFVSIDRDRLTCRPMKGTARRGRTEAEDAALAAELRRDAKQRAENLMIVDLMRNDLSRVAMPGTVAVPALFEVETYPTVHQMTSTVTARLAPGRDAVDVLAAGFPCGSITGAPKLRAMQAIAAIEARPRGLYTGSIGHIDSRGDAAFNVAIRTLSIRGGDRYASLALGAGIVADSVPENEWNECLAKAAFVGDGQRVFDLIETMAFDPETGIALLDRHLTRMKASAAALGFAFDRHGARNELQAATFRLREARRVRLMLSPSGAVAVETMAMPPARTTPLSVAIVPLPVAPDDLRLCHKTSDRGFYDRARAAAGTDEVVFERPDGSITEGSFTTVFVPQEGVLLTPAAGGLLPGVLREELLARGEAREAVLTRADLPAQILLGNALRGLMPARFVAVAKSPALPL
ncbi:aminodeoxychorismate synthase component I [Sphingomonas abaci]|uniref:Probable branched-chain-amino-acid aminotransferase n=1 Tax=Sphingomonas abaci TaxID=237611 RepID=A0A7W7AJ01_9SPHN|nr:aminodeoxychorismate synthase component I [Sphingomonas abaci]MBB4617919.1 para-aminobenzoate synthetase/4-amino-4-deoxychorismate lyase [Sphingomonas abaci]